MAKFKPMEPTTRAERRENNKNNINNLRGNRTRAMRAIVRPKGDNQQSFEAHAEIRTIPLAIEASGGEIRST